MQITGHGRAEASGQIELAITNIGAIEVTCTGVTLNFAHGHPLSLDVHVICAPSDQSKITIDVSGWPTLQAAQDATATVKTTLPNGQDYQIDVRQVTLTSEEMYTRANILEGLDL